MFLGWEAFKKCLVLSGPLQPAGRNDSEAGCQIFWVVLVSFLYIGICHQGCALLPHFLIVIITFLVCFLTYDALLLAQTSPRNYRFSQLLVSSIIYHSYELWPRKIVRNLTFENHAMLRTAAYFTQVIYCNILAFVT